MNNYTFALLSIDENLRELGDFFLNALKTLYFFGLS